jgi:outer membrane protein TolC
MLGCALFFNLNLIAPADAKPFTLDALLELAKKNSPTLVAGIAATAVYEAQLLEANRSWFPSGELSSYVAPIPEIRCVTSTPAPAGVDPNTWRLSHCDGTDWSFDKSNWADSITKLSGVFTRTELKLVQPLYTFGKLSAGISAAQSGVRASKSRQAGTVAELELSVRKAYFGVKLAREIQTTLEEGLGYIEEAQKKIDKELAEGTGEVSVTDRLRLRTVRAEIEARILESKRMGSTARSGIRALIGPGAPEDLDVDDDTLTPLVITPLTLKEYRALAIQNRPEVRALEEFITAKRALAELEWRKQYPDLVLVGTAQYAYANNVDHPKNAFANDPFNSAGIGLAAALRMPLDLGVKNARAHRLQAEANESTAKQREALAGIGFEVEKAFNEIKEAEERLKVMEKGEKAGRQWISAISQNLAVGLAEAKDFSDALLAFFQARIRYLQTVYDYNLAVAALSRATGTQIIAPPTANP